PCLHRRGPFVFADSVQLKLSCRPMMTPRASLVAAARGFATAAGFAADGGAAGVLGGPTCLDSREDAVLLAGRAEIIGATARGFAAARGLSGTAARRLNRATAARFNRTAASRLAAGVLGGQAGLQT